MTTLYDRLGRLHVAIGAEGSRRIGAGVHRGRMRSYEVLRAYARYVLRPIINTWTRFRALAGVQPLSEVWGCDRGQAVCRYYLEGFLRAFAADVRGHCLEFQNDGYTSWLGNDAIEQLDILHIDSSNPQATIVADLTKPNSIPSNVFDCIICTHVLHVIPDLYRAVGELHRILKPGGVLLVGVPHVSMCDPNWHELWRFTAEGLHVLLSKSFGAANVVIRAYGNSLTAAGQLRGLAAHEFTTAELGYHDSRFAVEICARATKG